MTEIASKIGIFSIDPETVTIGEKDRLGNPSIFATGCFRRGRFEYICPIAGEFSFTHPEFTARLANKQMPRLTNEEIADKALCLHAEKYPGLVGRIVLGVDVGISREGGIVYRYHTMAFWIRLDEPETAGRPETIEGLSLDTPSLVEAREAAASRG